MTTALIDDGGPAFPETRVDGIGMKDGVWHYPGMTLRDYFAAQAMTTIALFASQGLHNLGDGVLDASKSPEEKLAIDSYRLADAMLKARKA